MSTSPSDLDTITSWLSAATIALKRIDPGGTAEDLRAFASVAARARVVGLGEATHGTHEFFRLKHRLIEYLVLEHGYDTIAFESSQAAGEGIDRYLADGEGDPAELLTGQGYLAWDTVEVLELLAWLRRRNAGLPRDRRVRYHGLDINYNERSRIEVLAWLRRARPELAGEATAILDGLGAEEDRFPMRIDDASRERVAALEPRLDRLIDAISSGPGIDGEVTHCVERLAVMRQWASWTTGRPEQRTGFMGENLARLMEHRPSARVIVWAHNAHVGVIDNDGVPSMGAVARQSLGEGYLAIGFETLRGSYLGRSLSEDARLGELSIGTLELLAEVSLAGRLGRVGVRSALVDLGHAAGNRAVERWLRTPGPIHDASWLLRASRSREAVIREQYDMIAFVRDTGPSHPTADAVRRARAGEGL